MVVRAGETFMGTDMRFVKGDPRFGGGLMSQDVVPVREDIAADWRPPSVIQGTSRWDGTGATGRISTGRASSSRAKTAMGEVPLRNRTLTASLTLFIPSSFSYYPCCESGWSLLYPSPSFLGWCGP